MLTPRVIIVTIIVIALAVWVLMSSIDTTSKIVALVALVIAEALAFRRR